MKKCGYCRKEKQESEFGPNGQTADGLRWECRECRKQIYYENHERELKQKRRDYEKHKESRLLKEKKKYQDNPDKYKEKAKEYYHNNKEVVTERRKIYREENRDTILQKKREYEQKRRDEKKKEQGLFKSQLITVKYPDSHKVCGNCKSLKLKEEFYIKNKRHCSICKSCEAINRENYYEKNAEILRQRDKDRYYANHEETLRKKRIKQKSPQYKEWEKKYKSQLNVRLGDACRSRLNTAIKLYDFNKTDSTVEYLGCSIEFLKEYLAQKFWPGMTWDNWGDGNDDWQIDHKKPLCSMDLSIEENARIIFHYTNLQPLWKPDNLAKASEDKKLSIYAK